MDDLSTVVPFWTVTVAGKTGAAECDTSGVSYHSGVSFVETVTSTSFTLYIYIHYVYVYIQVVPGRAGGGSFKRKKNYIAKEESAYRMCAR